MQIPEGSLINGIITNEAELKEQLEDFWKENHLPKKNVELVVYSSQMILKQIELPVMKERRIKEALPLEFADSGDVSGAIFDYLPEEKEDGNMLILHGVMAEKSFVKGYVDLFASFGVKVRAVRPARMTSIRAMQTLKQLKGRTCMILMVDGTTINSNLWSNGISIYSSQKRVFCEPGTEQFAIEIARVVSNILQFSLAQHLERKISHVYLTGATQKEFSVYEKTIRNMDMGILLSELNPEKHIRVPKNSSFDCWMVLPLVGNLLLGKKELNLVLQIKKKKRDKRQAEAWKKYILLQLILILVLGSATGVLFHMKNSRQKQLDEINAYLNNESNLAICSQAEVLKQSNAKLSARITSIEKFRDILASYPHMNSTVVEQLSRYAEEKNVELEILSYSADTGSLSMDARAEQVTQINHFIDVLEVSGIFDDVQYTGYAYDEDTMLYTINVTCYLSENAGK
jgi:Tfp pilus assembly protein PilN